MLLEGLRDDFFFFFLNSLVSGQCSAEPAVPGSQGQRQLPLVGPHQARPLLTPPPPRPLRCPRVSLLPSWGGRRGRRGEWHRGLRFFSLHLKPADAGTRPTLIQCSLNNQRAFRFAQLVPLHNHFEVAFLSRAPGSCSLGSPSVALLSSVGGQTSATSNEEGGADPAAYPRRSTRCVCLP